MFITGTDTGVGKTLVTALIARSLAQDGLDVGAYKPLQSGHPLGHPDGDVMRLRRIGGITDAPEQMCFRALEEPLAPGLALARAGVSVTRDALLDHLAAYSARHANMLIEGAGGLCVPLTEDLTVADLACTVRLPVVIVARSGLGTVNHTALTVHYARSRGLSVAGVIVSGMPHDEDCLEWANIPMIEEAAKCPVLAVLPLFAPETGSVEQTLALDRQWRPSEFLSGKHMFVMKE